MTTFLSVLGLILIESLVLVGLLTLAITLAVNMAIRFFERRKTRSTKKSRTATILTATAILLIIYAGPSALAAVISTRPYQQCVKVATAHPPTAPTCIQYQLLQPQLSITIVASLVTLLLLAGAALLVQRFTPRIITARRQTGLPQA